MGTKAAARQGLVTVGALGNRTFTQRTGGVKKSDSVKWRDGGSTSASPVTGPAETDDITLTNGYDPEVDGPMLSNLLLQVGILRTTISQASLFGDMTRVSGAKPFVWTDAVLASVKLPETDANSGEVATYELVFSVGDVA